MKFKKHKALINQGMAASLLLTGVSGFASDDITCSDTIQTEEVKFEDLSDSLESEASFDNLPELESALEAAIKKVEEQNLVVSDNVTEASAKMSRDLQTPKLNEVIVEDVDEDDTIYSEQIYGEEMDEQVLLLSEYSQIVQDALSETKLKEFMEKERCDELRLDNKAKISERNDEFIYRNAFVNTPRKVAPLTRLTLKKMGYTKRFWWKTYLSVPKDHVAIGTIVNPRKGYQGKAGDFAIIKPGCWSTKEKHWKGFKIVKGQVKGGVSQLEGLGVFMRIPEGHIGIAKNRETEEYAFFPAGTSAFLDSTKYSDEMMLHLKKNVQLIKKGGNTYKFLKLAKDQILLVYDLATSTYKFIQNEGEYLFSDKDFNLERIKLISLHETQEIFDLDYAYLVSIPAGKHALVTYSESTETIKLNEGVYYLTKDKWQQPTFADEI